MDDAPVSLRDRLLTPLGLATASFALAGVLWSAVSTQLAVNAGEVPVTVLPFGADATTTGIAAVLGIRLLGVVLLVAAVDRWRPRSLPYALAVTGLFWTLVGAWQAWLLLART